MHKLIRPKRGGGGEIKQTTKKDGTNTKLKGKDSVQPKTNRI